jgi:hypothetical protein
MRASAVQTWWMISTVSRSGGEAGPTDEIRLVGVERAVMQEDHHLTGVTALVAEFLADAGDVRGQGFAHRLEFGERAAETEDTIMPFRGGGAGSSGIQRMP